MANLVQHLAPEDSSEFDSISYNKQRADELPEYGNGNILNRYKDILPNPRTMVKLRQKNEDPSSMYINANWVRNYAGDNGFIAAQVLGDREKESRYSACFKMRIGQCEVMGMPFIYYGDIGLSRCHELLSLQLRKLVCDVSGYLCLGANSCDACKFCADVMGTQCKYGRHADPIERGEQSKMRTLFPSETQCHVKL